jgi:hypothetical protein
LQSHFPSSLIDCSSTTKPILKSLVGWRVKRNRNEIRSAWKNLRASYRFAPR